MIFNHQSVLLRETVAGLDLKTDGQYLDATVGGGGHSEQILAQTSDSELWAIDRDDQALAAAQTRLQPWVSRVHFWRGNFAEFEPGAQRFDGIVADLGVNSTQLDQAERGFSFRPEAAGPLDMRMDRRQPLTAQGLVNQADVTELANWIYRYGEERLSRRIARRIVERRPFQDTATLASAIASVFPPRQRYGRIHPATRTFQALRIVVNGELEALEALLRLAPQWLKPGGRLGIISFHSLEDRLVKHGFRDHPMLERLTKKPIVATHEEIDTNPRARSAKLRFAQRLRD
ncbi:MAG: 16S rRNA (cytosine(1402)-N(4))-methyltransferase RsmH [Cyanobacteria bacterium P01_H01_bin.15]